jgi:hypothetical protein
MTRHRLAGISNLRAKQFLLDLANLSDESLDDYERRVVTAFEKRYSDILPVKWQFSVMKEILEEASRAATVGSLLWASGGNATIYTDALRDAVRAVWVAPDNRTKEWGVFRLIDAAQITETNPPPDADPATFNIKLGRVAPIPPPTPFEHCMRYLVGRGSKAAVCQHAECPGHYFFASRKNQKFCSPECALPAQRAFKRKWWAKNGRRWRARRVPP